MTELLDSIDTLVLGMYLTICCVHLFASKKVSSLLVAVAGLTFCEITSHMFKPSRWLVTEDVVMHVWYLGYMLIHIVTVALMVRMCKLLEGKVSFGLELKLTFLSQFLLFSIQGARYLDRVILESNLLGGFYQSSIPSINIVVVGVIFISTLNSLYNYLRKKKELNVD